ncbi:hypothetical protein ABZ622_38810 [Streptomyces sp. NPDC007164]|uniref:hypothetical protein n=1 Tax=Streptomyces sp. NPDC007164 TaxID=3156918 RepID=UPI0033FE4A2D
MPLDELLPVDLGYPSAAPFWFKARVGSRWAARAAAGSASRSSSRAAGSVLACSGRET